MNNKEAADILRKWAKENLLPDVETAFTLAIEALDPWTPPTATITWVNVKDHPHPIDNSTYFIALLLDFNSPVVVKCSSKDSAITHWCLLPTELLS